MFFVLLIGFLLTFVLFLRRKYGKLEKMGVTVIKPSVFGFGSGPVFMHKYRAGELDVQTVEKLGKVWGAYQGSEPFVFVADPAMLKQICVGSFDHFQTHGFVDGNAQPKKIRTIDATVGQEWKELRKSLSPTFTSGKIKGMLEPLGSACDNMVNYLEKKCKQNPLVDLKIVFQSMAMDVIGSCAFGIDINCFENPSNDILNYGLQMTAGFRSDGHIFDIFMLMWFSIPGFGKIFDASPFDMYYKLWNISKSIQDQRIASGIDSGIFLDRMIELSKQVKEGKLQNLTEDQLTAQGIVFFTAGFETTANTLTTLCYNLVKNPKAMEILQDEIDNMLDENDNRVDHETVSAMPYLEACIKEDLRMYSPVVRNDRTCTKDFQYGDINIPQGTGIMIPIYAVHHDPDNFPDPEEFQPARFLKENLDQIVPGSFLPFGIGPRACIGERFAMVEMKVAIVKLLQNFRLEMAEETKLDPYKGDFLFSYPNMCVNIYKK